MGKTMVVMLCKACHSALKQYDDIWICAECEKTEEEVENGKPFDYRRNGDEGDSTS